MSDTLTSRRGDGAAPIRCLLPPALASLVISPRGPMSDETAIAALETFAEHRFPTDYREVLLAWNGGVPDPRVLQVRGFEAEVVRYLYSVCAYIALFDLRQRLHALRGIVPNGYMAIGVLESGRLVVIDLLTPHGEVHLLSARPHEPRRLTCVAATFSDFLAALTHGR